MAKKVLFLDDMQPRHDVFKKQTIGVLVTHVYNAQDAITALDSEVFDVASLDHDLSLEAILTLPEAGASNKGEWSGYDVALHIASMPEDKRPKRVILHTLNPAGRDRMAAALDGAVPVVIIPFRA